MPSNTLTTDLTRLLARSSLHTDALLTHLHRLLSTSHGTDSLLCTTYYTLRLLHSQLTRLLAHRYEKLAFALVSNASRTLLPGETVVAAIEPPALTLTAWCASVKALGDTVEDARMFLRLGGLVRIYLWAKDAYMKPKRDPAIKMLVWARIVAATGYQGLENAAFLMRRGVFRGQGWAEREPVLWAWSARFWTAEVVCELLRLARVRQLRFKEEFGAERVDDGEDDKSVKVQSRELKQRWQRELYTALAWLPASLHFGVYDEDRSPIGEAWYSAAGMIPGLLSLREAWRETA